MTAPLMDREIAQMTDFKPFSGFHYNAEKINFEEVLAPPYDVISEDEQNALYEKSPYNCIRLILNKILSEDSETNNRYTRARDFFNGWVSEEVLISDKEPAFYLYRQTFKDPETGEERQRLALLGRLKLEPFEKEVVIPHENTLSGPRKDRTQLLRSVNANLSPVFGLYEDPGAKLKSAYAEITEGAPLFKVPDTSGICHELWIVQDAEKIKQIQQTISDKKIYIADGHHRYTTALHFGQEMRTKRNIDARKELGSDYILMALVEFHDPGLALFATHRLVKDFTEAKSLKAPYDISSAEALKEHFEVEEKTINEIEEILKKPKTDKILFGLTFKNKSYLLTLKDLEKSKQLMPEGHADIWYTLDVNILPHLIFTRLWGLEESSWEEKISYTHSFGEAKNKVENEKVAAAFILQAPKVEILRDMGAAGELMAQKSTYFYPKLASGLVFHHHDPSLIQNSKP